MNSISDEFGIWRNLGLLSPQDRIWLQFPEQSTSTDSLLRISCFSDYFNRINSYGLIRAKYQLSNTVVFSLETRFFPRADKQLIEIPIPKILITRNIYARYFEVMKIIRYRRRVGITNNILWDIKLEELEN
ncbi:hypothetical protein [Tolypothrix sp. PCC 7601]|uniref:hypothetical protein n=1 Tax=Tolypothrix sp. PCC 7601 TaxID=1188 RepID=UPI0021DF8609|nr:hypothetical protein [Tolypothrix sp. PCC 7601]UYD38978.1 hypothetical protein HG267_41405 [Tolypothrix sp. PCC 7601]